MMTNIPRCNDRNIWQLQLPCVRLCSYIIFVAALSERFRLKAVSTKLEFWEQNLYCRAEVKFGREIQVKTCTLTRLAEVVFARIELVQAWCVSQVPYYCCEKTLSKATFKRRNLTGDLLTLSVLLHGPCGGSQVAVRRDAGAVAESSLQIHKERWRVGGWRASLKSHLHQSKLGTTDKYYFRIRLLRKLSSQVPSLRQFSHDLLKVGQLMRLEWFKYLCLFIHLCYRWIFDYQMWVYYL